MQTAEYADENSSADRLKALYRCIHRLPLRRGLGASCVQR